MVPLTNNAAKAAYSVLPVVSSPIARFVPAAKLLVKPKLIIPPVVESPQLAPKRLKPAACTQPYHPAIAERPSPPLPLGSTGNAKSHGLSNEYVIPPMVTGLPAATDVRPGFGSVSKFCE